MAQMEFVSAVLEQKCHEAVDQLIARHHWSLLPHEDFVRCTIEQVTAGPVREPRRAAIAIYCRVLYAACSGNEGEQRQNQAYAELFRYLYDSARRYPDVREDVTQQALERTFRSFERCREPSAFLAFALQHLMDAAKVLRQQERRAWPLVAPEHADLDVSELLPDLDQPDPSAQIIAADLRTRFDGLADEFLRKHPRATLQLAALRLKYIDGLDEAAISKTLGKSTGSIYVLRSRAIEKLREDPGWRALAIEFGILPEEPEEGGV